MMHLPASVRVYLCLTACDMRKSFVSLHALVRDHLELDAFAGQDTCSCSPAEVGVGQAPGGRHVCAAYRGGAGPAAARDHHAGVGSVAERHRSAARRAAPALRAPRMIFGD